MSGIYIPGMEMPTKCADCEVASDDCVCPFVGLRVYTGKLSVCPLIPVPDHGRLIDADAIRNEIDMARPGRSYEDAWALTIVDNAITVIAADKTDEEKK